MYDTFSCMFSCYKYLTSRSIFSGRSKGVFPLFQSNIFHYRPQQSCGEGYVFTRVCDSINTPRRRLLLRTVRILLECILVFMYFSLQILPSNRLPRLHGWYFPCVKSGSTTDI